VVAVVCLATTQTRSLANTTVPSFITALFIVIIAVIQVHIVATNPNHAKREMQYFGNGEEEVSKRIVRGSLGASIPIWAYVPTLILTELLGDMRRPVELVKSFQLSAVVTIALFIGVGSFICAHWGFEQTNPLMITAAWGAASHAYAPALKDVLNVLLLVCNLTAYCLDTVPVALATVRVYHPRFFEKHAANPWTARAILEFLLLTLPPWLFALSVAVVVPNLFDLLAFVTAFTTPAISMGFPAACFYCYFNPDAALSTPLFLSVDGGTQDEAQSKGAGGERGSWANRARGLRTCSSVEHRLCIACFVTFIGAFLTCMVGAIGQVAIAEWRGTPQVGCASWGL
jgi:hypothetical protein